MLSPYIFNVFARSGPNPPPQKVREWRQCESIVCLPIKVALEAENEHLAAEVCGVTVSSVRFDCYLQ